MHWIGAVHTAFQDGEKSLDGIRVCVAPDVFVKPVIDRLVRGEAFADAAIRRVARRCGNATLATLGW